MLQKPESQGAYGFQDRIRLMPHRWRKDAGARIEGSTPFDNSKVQAPCIVRNPSSGYRIFYTAVGPGNPFPDCQGYILSAVSEDGLVFQKEPGIRLAPQPSINHISLRVLAPTVTRCLEGGWRMYFEARGPASHPTVICSAISHDMLQWNIEAGIRLRSPGGLSGPRYLELPGGRGRLYCCKSELGQDTSVMSKTLISAVTSNGLDFEFDQAHDLRSEQVDYDTAGVTAAEPVPPETEGDRWTMIYSAWQDVPSGTVVPIHPSSDTHLSKRGTSIDFARASIAVDMAGYRSRIFESHSTDGRSWSEGQCVIDGGGYDEDELDAVHAEDMSLIKVSPGLLRMYYAACDKHGNWRITSAHTET